MRNEMTREERQKAIDALKISAPVKAVTQEEFNDYIQTLNKIMDWLEQDPCEDAISRAEAQTEIMMSKSITAFDRDLWIRTKDAVHILRELPSVTQKYGKWILLDECANSGYYCSNCQKKLVKEGWSQTVKKIKYCPNCGAKMQKVRIRNE